LIWIKGLAIPSAFVVFADIWSDKDAIQSLYGNSLDEVAGSYQYDHRFYCVTARSSKTFATRVRGTQEATRMKSCV